MATKNISETKPDTTWGLHSSDGNLREGLDKCRKASMSLEIRDMSPVEYIEYVLRSHVRAHKNPLKWTPASK